MADEPTVTGGAPGEPAAPPPAADGSQLNVDDIIAAVNTPAPPPAKAEPDAELMKKLESMDPGDLPVSLRTKLEDPFRSLYTKKTTDWDQERKRYLDTIDRLTTRPPGAPEPTGDQKALLLQKLSEGDGAAVESIIKGMVEAETGPQIRAVNFNNSMQVAERLEPSIRDTRDQVAQVLTENKELNAIVGRACAENPQLGGFLVAGIAKALKADALASQLKAMEASIQDKVRKAVDETQKRLKALPTSTSQGGSRPSATAKEGEYDRIKARDEAWAEAGGRG